MCTTSGTGRCGEAGVGREDLGSAEDLDEASGAAGDRDEGQRQQGRRNPPTCPGSSPTRPPSRHRRCAGAGLGAVGRRGRRGVHSTPAVLRCGTSTASCWVSVSVAGDLPQRVAQGDHGDAVGEGQQAVDGVGHHREGCGGEAGDGEQGRGPAGQDTGAVQRDAEEQAADQVGEPAHLDGGRERTDVTVHGAAAGVDSDGVVDEPGVGGSDLRQHVGGSEGDAHDAEVADREHHVADEPEEPVLADLVQVHAGDAGQGQCGHQHLQGVADVDVGGLDGGGVQLRVVDLDADEDGTGGGGGDTGPPGQQVRGDGHVWTPSRVGPWPVPRGYLEPRKGQGGSASPHDVTDDVTSAGPTVVTGARASA